MQNEKGYRNNFSNQDKLTDKMKKKKKMEIMRQVKHQHCHLLESRYENAHFNEYTDKTVFELPDKNKIVFGKELFTTPELYFTEGIQDTAFKGIQHLIVQCLEKCEPEQRK